MRGSVLNCRSVRNKTDYLRDIIIDNKLDIFGLTETWLKSDEKHIIGEIVPDGYSYHSVPRAEGLGGGLLLIYKSTLNVKFTTQNSISFESLYCDIKLDNRLVRFLLVYRPPPSPKNGYTNAQFLSEISDCIAAISTLTGDVLISGDFNVHFDDENAPLVKIYRTYSCLVVFINMFRIALIPQAIASMVLSPVLMEPTLLTSGLWMPDFPIIKPYVLLFNPQRPNMLQKQSNPAKLAKST